MGCPEVAWKMPLIRQLEIRKLDAVPAEEKNVLLCPMGRS